MKEVGHFIGGKHVAGTSGRSAEYFQPMDGTVLGRVALASKAEVRFAIETAKAAHPKWAATNHVGQGSKSAGRFEFQGRANGVTHRQAQ